MKKPDQANPIAQFQEWLAEAYASEPVNPNAMSLATATPQGVPSVRMVLLKDADQRGFVFYTNLESNKGVQLDENAACSLCFYWKSLARQVRVEGRAEPVDAAEADAYFATRPRQARIGAWASKQSQPLRGLGLTKRHTHHAAPTVVVGTAVARAAGGACSGRK